MVPIPPKRLVPPITEAEIAAKFDAQRILYLDLIQFASRETDSVNLLRGRIWAQVRVYEIDSADPEKVAYETEVQVIYPEQAPTPISDNARIAVRQGSINLFAQELARKFYTHKITIR